MPQFEITLTDDMTGEIEDVHPEGEHDNMAEAIESNRPFWEQLEGRDEGSLTIKIQLA